MATVVAINEGSVASRGSESKDKNENNHEVSSDDGSDDKKTSNSSGTKRPVPAAELDDDKKAERRAANRRSAFQSRQRRKILIDDLQGTVAALSKDNGDLRRAHDEMRAQLEAALLENHQLRMQQQLTGMSAISNPAAALFGVQALQQAQAQAALLRGGNPALAQLLASGGASVNAGGAATVAVPTAQTEDRGDTKLQGPAASTTQQEGVPASTGQVSGGIQGILNAASAANGQAGNAAVLQHFLQHNTAHRNSPLAGLSPDAAHLAGLKGLLDQLCGSNASTPGTNNTIANAGQSSGNVSDALRAMLHTKSKQ